MPVRGSSLHHHAARAMAALCRRRTDVIRSWLTPWLLYSVGPAARAASAVTMGRFEYVGNVSATVSPATGYGRILSALSLFAPLGEAAASIQTFQARQPKARFTLAILFGCEPVLGAAAGGKRSFVIAVLVVVIPMSAADRRLSKVVVFSRSLVFQVAVIPFNEAHRAAARGESTTLFLSQAFHAASEILHQTLLAHNVTGVLPSSMAYLMQRSREIDSPAIIFALAPRAPVGPANQSWPLVTSSARCTTACLPISTRHRPLPGGGFVLAWRVGPVTVGMCLPGCAVRLLDDSLDMRAAPQTTFLVLLISPSVVNVEQDWVTMVASIPATVLVWLAAVMLAFRSGRPR